MLLLICFLIHSIAVALVFPFILLFCWLSVLCCLCSHCVLEPYYSFAIITLYLFLFLFSFLTHCYSLFNSFHCSCSDFLCILLFCQLLVLCCLCCHCVLETCCPFAIVAFYVFLILFSLSSHCFQFKLLPLLSLWFSISSFSLDASFISL